MKNNQWRGQTRAPADLMKWVKSHAGDRFTSMNSIIVEALREYKARRTSTEARDAARQ